MYSFSNSPKRRTYEAPKVEVIVVESQGVLCSSAEGGTLGNTESMNMTNINWP